MRSHTQQHRRCTRRHTSPLLPTLQRPLADPDQCCELELRHLQSLTGGDDIHRFDPEHPAWGQFTLRIAEQITSVFRLEANRCGARGSSGNREVDSYQIRSRNISPNHIHRRWLLGCFGFMPSSRYGLNLYLYSAGFQVGFSSALPQVCPDCHA
jgi:hypothetical protein